MSGNLVNSRPEILVVLFCLIICSIFFWGVFCCRVNVDLDLFPW